MRIRLPGMMVEQSCRMARSAELRGQERTKCSRWTVGEDDATSSNTVTGRNHLGWPPGQVLQGVAAGRGAICTGYYGGNIPARQVGI
jgi:hypothetical protein